MGKDSIKSITFDENEIFEDKADIYEKVRREKRRRQKLEREELIQSSSYSSLSLDCKAFKKFNLKQLNSNYSYQLPITNQDAIILSTVNKITKKTRNNLNLIGFAYKRAFNDTKEYFQISNLVGFSKFISSFNGAMKLSPNFNGSIETQALLYPSFQLLSFHSSVERRLYYGFVGRTTFDFINFSSKVAIKKKYETHITEYRFKGGENSSMGITYTKELSSTDNLNIGSNIGYSLSKGNNFNLNLTLSTYITNDLEAGTGISITNDGIDLTLNFRKDRNVFELPISLYQEFSLSNLFYSCLIPSVLYLISSKLIIEPLKKRSKRLRLIEKRENNILITKSASEKAQEFIASVNNEIILNMNKEESKRGLVIINAKYGVLDDEFEVPHVGYIDVTQPLQYLVNNSQIHLDETSKSQLNGFYDPCPGEFKVLEVTYYFKGKKHYTKVDDEEELNIPLASHLIE